jgi:hypothetical protein
LVERTLGEDSRSKEMADPRTGAENSVVSHMRNWLECVRTRQTPVADVEAGYNHSVALCMTIAALHSGKRATFNEVKQEVILV